MTIETHLRLAGATLLVLAAAHPLFAKRFRWREELAQLSLLNRQIFLVHTFFICLVLVMMGALSAFAPAALLKPTPLARLVLAGLTVFWALRLVVQWFVYDARLWRGSRFRTVMHVLFTCLWGYLTAVFAWGWWSVRI